MKRPIPFSIILITNFVTGSFAEAPVKSGELKLVGAYYDLDDGKVQQVPQVP